MPHATTLGNHTDTGESDAEFKAELAALIRRLAAQRPDIVWTPTQPPPPAPAHVPPPPAPHQIPAPRPEPIPAPAPAPRPAARHRSRTLTRLIRHGHNLHTTISAATAATLAIGLTTTLTALLAPG